MKLYFITHPAVNIDPKTPVSRWDISKEGWKQVERLSKEAFWKEVGAIFASTEPKANMAAEFWSKKFNIPMKVVDGIQEINRSSTGFLPDEEHAEIVNGFYENPTKRIRGWESANECIDRMNNAMNKIIDESKGNNVAVVSHGAVGNLYVCYIMNIKPSPRTVQKKIGSWAVINVGTKQISGWKDY